MSEVAPSFNEIAASARLIGLQPGEWLLEILDVFDTVMVTTTISSEARTLPQILAVIEPLLWSQFRLQYENESSWLPIPGGYEAVMYPHQWSPNSWA